MELLLFDSIGSVCSPRVYIFLFSLLLPPPTLAINFLWLCFVLCMFSLLRLWHFVSVVYDRTGYYHTIRTLVFNAYTIYHICTMRLFSIFLHSRTRVCCKLKCLSVRQKSMFANKKFRFIFCFAALDSHSYSLSFSRFILLLASDLRDSMPFQFVLFVLCFSFVFFFLIFYAYEEKNFNIL